MDLIEDEDGAPYPPRIQAAVESFLAEPEQHLIGVRVARALERAECGQVDGDHHKAWALDEIVRALLGAPPQAYMDGDELIVTSDDDPRCAAYKAYIDDYEAGDPADPDDYYEWERGTAP